MTLRTPSYEPSSIQVFECQSVHKHPLHRLSNAMLVLNIPHRKMLQSLLNLEAYGDVDTQYIRYTVQTCCSYFKAKFWMSCLQKHTAVIHSESQTLTQLTLIYVTSQRSLMAKNSISKITNFLALHSCHVKLYKFDVTDNFRPRLRVCYLCNCSL